MNEMRDTSSTAGTLTLEIHENIASEIIRYNRPLPPGRRRGFTVLQRQRHRRAGLRMVKCSLVASMD